MTKRRTPSVVLQPAAGRALQRGIAQMVQAVRPTLGPRARMVMLQRVDQRQAPELLDDGGLIARRIVALPNRDEDIGAMTVRHLMWKMKQTYGDGATTAGILFQSVFDQGLQHLAHGGNAMMLRRHLDRGARLVIEELAQAAIPVRGKAQLRQIAQTACQDGEIAATVAEIFSVIGPHGHLDIREGQHRDVTHAIVDGLYWPGEVLARSMFTDKVGLRTVLSSPAMLVTNLVLADPYAVARALQTLSEGGVTHLLWIASQASPDVLSVFEAANRHPNKFFAVVVCPREFKSALDELALATGANLILREAGYTEQAVGPHHLGRAKSAWVDRDHFGILASTHARAAIRQRLTGLTQAFDQAEAADTKARDALRVRIGRLAGKSAIVTVGGVTERDISARRQALEHAAQAVRAALLGGVLPGGGVALLGCQEKLRNVAARSACEDERAAIRILIRALEQPFRSLLCNAGMDETEWLAGVRNARAATTGMMGVDVLNRRTANMVKAGIVDVASVQKAAVYGAVTGAALALTVDVLVERKKPVESYTTA